MQHDLTILIHLIFPIVFLIKFVFAAICYSYTLRLNTDITSFQKFVLRSFFQIENDIRDAVQLTS